MTPPPATPSGGLFDADYHRILEPFHPPGEARRETGALRELLGLAQDDRVLDLGCGWGRHLRLLREAGHDVVGLDLSLPLLRQAAAGMGGPRSGPSAGGLVAGDMLRLPFARASFDVVINLATSLGLFLDDAPARRALADARRVLRPGGRLLLEGMHRENVEPAFAPRDRWTLHDGTVVRARRRFDPARGISHEVLRWTDRDGRTRSKRHSLRIRSAAGIAALVEEAGLRVRELWGDWDGEPLEPSSERLVLLAHAPV